MGSEKKGSFRVLDFDAYLAELSWSGVEVVSVRECRVPFSCRVYFLRDRSSGVCYRLTRAHNGWVTLEVE